MLAATDLDYIGHQGRGKYPNPGFFHCFLACRRLYGGSPGLVRGKSQIFGSDAHPAALPGRRNCPLRLRCAGMREMQNKKGSENLFWEIVVSLERKRDFAKAFFTDFSLVYTQVRFSKIKTDRELTRLLRLSVDLQGSENLRPPGGGAKKPPLF
jgi:hypothetical protein